MRLQVQANSDSPVHGQFMNSPGRDEPYREISQGCWPWIGLCELASAAPDHPDAARWREAIARFTQDYLLPMAHRNNYGIVPYGLFVGEDPGGNRRIGRFWYRYFMRPERGWWVGINANLASTGVGLIKASRVLSDPRLAAQAQRQLDWILGANPHNASTVEGVGHNHPGQFINGSEFKPATPRLPGAVMNGMGGTQDDQPDLYDGQYHTAEYWTPMVAYTMWLMAELQR